MARTTQKSPPSQAASQVAREPTRVHALTLLLLERLPCIATFTTGSVQPNAKKNKIIAYSVLLVHQSTKKGIDLTATQAAYFLASSICYTLS